MAIFGQIIATLFVLLVIISAVDSLQNLIFNPNFDFYKYSFVDGVKLITGEFGFWEYFGLQMFLIMIMILLYVLTIYYVTKLIELSEIKPTYNLNYEDVKVLVNSIPEDIRKNMFASDLKSKIAFQTYLDKYKD